MVAVFALVLLVGPLPLLRPERRAWWNALERPEWAPTARPAAVSGVLVAAIEAIAAWLVWQEVGWGAGIVTWLIHVAIAPLWWSMLIGRQRLSAAFTVLCVDWAALGIATAAFWVFVEPAGWLALASLAWLTWMGAVVFFLWQLNQPSRRH
ncbi:MAG: tryptophan-rich sensory protein [Acidimicrobiia bacterium]